MHEAIDGQIERRHELADFLRTRRERLTPALVGLPAGTRRRTPGLRREEVAQLAEIGTTWYTRLEQEWDIHVSPTALEGIARALRLNAEERRHLFLLADQPLPLAAPPLEEAISAEIRRLLDSLDAIPAHVVGRRYDHLAHNAASARVFDPTAPPPHPRNLVWSLFTDPARRTFHADWEAVAQKVLAEFRADSARYPGDPWFAELIADLRRTSPEFQEWWPQHDVRGHLDGRKEMRHPLVGTLVFQHTTLAIPAHPNLKLMLYVPLPEANTAAKLAQLLCDTDAAPDTP